ncbi:unnamed protein product [Moneuplotes crassus]|uniref:Uncharacterized protein n=1 Tax=Euplotes crassus TaxID=5936 RepID=A0AAD1XET5_EUPCR|nr:unnamed protein product [Moneuplotes crassus]
MNDKTYLESDASNIDDVPEEGNINKSCVDSSKLRIKNSLVENKGRVRDKQVFCDELKSLTKRGVFAKRMKFKAEKLKPLEIVKINGATPQSAMVAPNELCKKLNFSEDEEQFGGLLKNESCRFSRVKSRKIPSHKMMAVVLSHIKAKENNNLS